MRKLPADLRAWRRSLARLQIKQLIITRGRLTTLCLSADDYFETPTLEIKPIDTVGAGDAFTGVFVARRAAGADVRTCIRYANCAGGLATLKPGAQEAIPNRQATQAATYRLSPN